MHGMFARDEGGLAVCLGGGQAALQFSPRGFDCCGQLLFVWVGVVHSNGVTQLIMTMAPLMVVVALA